MAIVITNGTYYIAIGENGKCIKTVYADKATQFENVDSAVKYSKYAPAKTKKYYVYDTKTKTIVYGNGCLKDMSDFTIKRKKIRKKYSVDARQLLYDKYDGVCQLCGKKLIINEMTLDHIIPLGVGVLDDVSNLQIACKQCNFIKADSLPEDFADRISSIFMYQMEKKRKDNLMWKIARTMINGII